MKVLIWCCGFERYFAGQYVYAEARRQGYDVEIVGTRKDASQVMPTVERYRPDWVLSFVVRPNYVRVSRNAYTGDIENIYHRIRAAGTRLAFWYPDQCESRRDAMIKKLKGVADLFIFSIKHTAIEYAGLAPQVVWMPQYFDASQCGQLPMRLDPSKEQWDVVFLGSVDRRRREWLKKLGKKYRVLSRVTRTEGHLYGAEMAAAYAQSRIAINIQRAMFLNPGPFITSNRMYNAMGCGCFFLQHRMNRLDLLFDEGRHCVTYDDTYDDMARKIDHYLENGQEREKIARTGQVEVLRGHTLEVRTPQYWNLMEDYDDTL
jgi:hypothetical protein